MPYVKKVWTTRNRQYQNRFTLAPTGTHNEYDLVRVEGTISQVGTPLSIANLNDHETAIEEAVLKSETALTYAEGLNQGYYFDKEYSYQRNTKLIDDCESIWANNNWGGDVGTASLDPTNYKVGTYGAKCTNAAVGYGGIHKVKALDLTKFTDGSASTTADYICFWLYIETAEINKLPVGGLKIVFQNDADGTNTNLKRIGITKASLSNGWNPIVVAKSAFTTLGAGAWSGITGLTVAIDGTASDTVTFTVDTIYMIRKDPLANVPNQFQREIDGVWTRDFAISAGGWFVGLENGAVTCRNLSTTNTVPELLFTKGYTNCIINSIIKCGTAQWGYGGMFYIDASNYILFAVGVNTLYLSKTVAGVTTDLTASLAVAVNDKLHFKLVKLGTSVSLSVIKNNDLPVPLSTTFSPTGVGYLGMRSSTNQTKGDNIESLSITTTEHAHHCDVAEIAKDISTIKHATGSFTDTTTSVPSGAYTKTIPLGFYATSGNLFIKPTADLGHFIKFDTNINNTVAMGVSTDSFVMFSGSDSDFGTSIKYGNGGALDYIKLVDVYISGTNLIVTFNNVSASNQTMDVEIAKWEVFA